MKIAVTSEGRSLDSILDPRFGRCPYFIVVNSDDLSFETIENPGVFLGSGAGIKAAQVLAEKGTQYVLTGNCGPNAHQTLSAAGIKVIVNCSGTIYDAVQKFKNGLLSATEQPNVAGHFGTQANLNTPDISIPAGATPGMGRGMGRGMGGGMGGLPIAGSPMSAEQEKKELSKMKEPGRNPSLPDNKKP